MPDDTATVSHRVSNTTPFARDPALCAPFAFPVEKETWIVFRPWSHTDKRKMLSIIEAPFGSVHEALEALPRHSDQAQAQAGTLFPLGHFSYKTHPISLEQAANPEQTPPLAYIAVSWSRRSPHKLKAASRLYTNGVDAENWADFCADLPENTGRVFGVLRAEGTIPPTFSPNPRRRRVSRQRPIQGAR